MSFTPKPCPHCGGVSFQIVPNLQLELYQPAIALGMAASRSTGVRWTFSLVVCTRCGRSDTFTMNGPELGQRIPGAYFASCAPGT